MPGQFKILLVGCTGGGKSSFGNLLAKHFHSNLSHFSEDALGRAHTLASNKVMLEDFTIIDTPGLVDPRGDAQDEENIKGIVQFVKQEHTINAITFVVNSQCPRFDSGMLKAIKLLFDSFGPNCISKFNFIYTRCPFAPEVSIETRTQSYISMINEKCHTHINHIPSWFVDCHPESLVRSHGVDPSRVPEIERTTAGNVSEMVLWAKSQIPPLSTADAVYGEYEATQKLKEIEKKRRYDASVIATETVHRDLVVSSVTTPIMETYTYTTGHGGIFHSGKKTHTAQRQNGSRTATTWAREEQTVSTLGSGMKTYGPWTQVNTWVVNS